MYFVTIFSPFYLEMGQKLVLERFLNLIKRGGIRNAIKEYGIIYNNMTGANKNRDIVIEQANLCAWLDRRN